LDNYQSKFIPISGVVPKAASTDRTGMVLNNINTSKTVPFHKILSSKGSLPDFSYDNNNNGFEKFLEFVINEILNELKNIVVSNNELAKKKKNCFQGYDGFCSESNRINFINKIIDWRIEKKRKIINYYSFIRIIK